MKIALPEIKLVGLTTRTNNKSEMDPSTAKIGQTLQTYFQQGLPNTIPNRKRPGITYCAYTEYESDFMGDYTYFVGEEVQSFDTIPEGFESLLIPAQVYEKVTTEAGPMPGVVIEAWQRIWQKSAEDLGGQRGYLVDFELYDERAADPANTVADIYIGIT